MKIKLISTIVLSIVFMISACGPIGGPPQTENPSDIVSPAVSEIPSQPEQLPVTTEPLTMVTEESAPTEPPPSESPPTPIPMPTSRGPNLEATNPSTVALASGSLHLVEFFRFT